MRTGLLSSGVDYLYTNQRDIIAQASGDDQALQLPNPVEFRVDQRLKEAAEKVRLFPVELQELDTQHPPGLATSVNAQSYSAMWMVRTSRLGVWCVCVCVFRLIHDGLS